MSLRKVHLFLGCLLISVVLFLVISLEYPSSTASSGNLRKVKSMAAGASFAKNAVSKQLAHFPSIIYGTAWKKERTKDLVVQAVKAGFRAVDTACQPKHYHEAGVGEALTFLYDEGIVSRNEMFLQTKFTPLNGQDPAAVPYDTTKQLFDQVLESIDVSLVNLRTNFLDGLLLHSPMRNVDDTITVWRAFESMHKKGVVKQLGLSNTYDLDILTAIYDAAEIKPTILQNRFYDKSGYDVAIRQYCETHNIYYESFWTLTANPHIISSPLVAQLAKKYSCTREQLFFRFVRTLGIIPLSGTTSLAHMQEDLAVEDIPLSADDAVLIAAMMKL